ncbi:metalloregulator ArsR/SmtB family transcription factor [uncultured Leifsonia sp.]|uniref:ArsR/SmtB family transcription factor n=1 Tax=uncultured Leifsonia sp. TaxID=340359 RepID=UPI0028D142B0|nr:metalloregulator ArsR/SmtB family transcription factor [uncultured Leifsonia sp.]
MVVRELADAEVDRIFQALADATRRDIVARSLGAEHSVSELAARYDMSFAAVQKHVAVLERAGLVTKTARGRERVVSGDPEAIRRASRLLDGFEAIWRRRDLAIDGILAEDAGHTDERNGR